MRPARDEWRGAGDAHGFKILEMPGIVAIHAPVPSAFRPQVGKPLVGRLLLETARSFRRVSLKSFVVKVLPGSRRIDRRGRPNQPPQTPVSRPQVYCLREPAVGRWSLGVNGAAFFIGVLECLARLPECSSRKRPRDDKAD